MRRHGRSILPAHERPLRRRRARALGRARAAAAAAPAAHARRVRRPAARARRGLGAPARDRGRPAALADPLRPARASGKTTLARIVAERRPAPRSRSSRPSRRASTTCAACMQRARDRLGGNGQRTILFLDEIHRFNKAQQDALLPAVEEGLVTLIGATTENPYFEVNSALLSRCQVYELEPLTEEELARGRAARRGRARAPRSTDELVDADRPAGRRRRAHGARHARARLGDGAGRGRAARGAARRGRGPQAAAPLRQGRRPALRLRLRVHQVDARLRPRRGRLLPRRDARGRRGPALHRAADDHPRLRGRRQRRPARAARRRRGGARARARRPAGGAAQPRPGRDLPRAGAEVERERDRDLGGARRRCASAATCARRRCSATRSYAGAKKLGHGEGYVYPHDDPRGFELDYLPEELRGRRYYRPSGNGEEAADDDRDRE